MKKNIEVLEEVLNVLEEEKRKFFNLVNQNEFRIEEINSYLSELSNEEDEDFKVFSPRNVENVHRNQIEADTSDRQKYEKENLEYNKKIDDLKTLIDKVNIVIGNLQTFDEKEEQNENIVENEEIVENIKIANADNNAEKNILERKHIAHQISNCVSFITSDVQRAKIELNALAKKLMED